MLTIHFIQITLSRMALIFKLYDLYTIEGFLRPKLKGKRKVLTIYYIILAHPHWIGVKNK